MSLRKPRAGLPLSTLALTLGATVRLTRFVVADKLGEWLIHEPIDERRYLYAARKWAENRDKGIPGFPSSPYGLIAEWDEGYEAPSKWWRYREGLDCPWCVGYWLGAGVLAGSVLTHGTRAEKPWRFLLGTLTLNVASVAVASLPGFDIYGMHDGDENDAPTDSTLKDETE